MTRGHVDKVDIEAVDSGQELRQGVELGFGPSPVVAGTPVLHERLQLSELYPLRLVIDCLPIGPACCQHPPAKIQECLFRDVDAEGADCVVLDTNTHPSSPLAGWLARRLAGSCLVCRSEVLEKQADGSSGC